MIVALHLLHGIYRVQNPAYKQTPTVHNTIMDLKNFLWLAPFFSFIFGYLVMQKILHIPETLTPALVGKQIHTVLPLITQHNLNIRLIDQKEEADLPEGIILNQTPAAGTAIKQNQPVFLVTTKKPVALRAPQCIGIHADELYKQLQAQGIQPRMYYLPHPYPNNLCFAQSPQPNEILEKNRIIIYVSAGNNKPIIWPDLTHNPLQEVVDFLSMYNIQPDIIFDTLHSNSLQQDYTVIDQRPFAGTLLTLDENKPLSVQLRVN